MGLVDFFDVNAIGSDSHLQFTNWAIDNNGAYDYAADTRGYTYAAIAEYQSPRFGVRFGEALMPTVASVTSIRLTESRPNAVAIPFCDLACTLLSAGCAAMAAIRGTGDGV